MTPSHNSANLILYIKNGRSWNISSPLDPSDSYSVSGTSKIIVTAVPISDSTFSLEYWLEGEEFTSFEKTYMGLLVWDENASAFRIMAIVCAGIFGSLILCGFGCGIKSCVDRRKRMKTVEIERQNTINSQKYTEQK